MRGNFSNCPSAEQNFVFAFADYEAAANAAQEAEAANGPRAGDAAAGAAIGAAIGSIVPGVGTLLGAGIGTLLGGGGGLAVGAAMRGNEAENKRRTALQYEQQYRELVARCEKTEGILEEIVNLIGEDENVKEL